MFELDQAADPFAGTRGAAHPNPMYDYLTGFTPRKLKDLFRWAEYIGMSSPHIYGVVRKFGEYPITRFVYTTDEDSERNRHEKLFDEHLRFKGFLTEVSFDVWLYGNCFVSVIEPVKRDLQCPRCKTREDITAAQYTFNLDKLEFKHNCRVCGGKQVLSKVIDEPLREPERLHLTRWDPKLIDIEENRFTGERAYYYTIPRADVAAVRAGNRLAIDHTPMELLSAMREKKTFKFAQGAIYHLKMPAPAGLQCEWGYPPITAAIKMFLFAAILRRANEAIAMEYLTPFRILHPAAASGAGDPFTTLNLDRWRRELEANYRIFRRDPLRFMTSPIPVGVQNVGGDGRTLLTLGELQEAEKNIVISLGVPLEFLTGGLGQTRGEITLRMIENQLRTHIENLNGLIRWVERRTSAFLKWKTVPVKLADFKMVDDAENKAFKAQLWQAGIVSNSTMADTADVDLHDERKLRKQDALDDARVQAETDIALKQQQQSLSLTSRQQAIQNQGGTAYDPQQVLAANQPLAEQLAQIDPGSRTSRLDDLKKEDPVAYAVVRMMIEDMVQMQNQQAKAQAQGQGQAT